MYHNNNHVKSIKNKFERTANEARTRPELRRCATSIGPFIPKNDTSLQPVETRPKIAAPSSNFQRSKTSLDLQNVSKTSPQAPRNIAVSRQLSDSSANKKGIKRTPAFRCDKSIVPERETREKSRHSTGNCNGKSNLSTKIKLFEQCKTPAYEPKPKPDIPPYAIVNKKISNSPSKFKSNQVLKDELEEITKRRFDYERLTREKAPQPLEIIKPKISPKIDEFICDNLTDTLKKALKSPLPEGPPPKKPPRTFAHSPQTSKIPTKKRNNPKLMLEKLETAMLQNKLKSPRGRRKQLDIENIKLNSDSLKKTNNEQVLFSDCFPLCNSVPAYATSQLPPQSQSEFFVDCSSLDSTTKGHAPLEHVYAEPFQFKKNVPDIKKVDNSRLNLNRPLSTFRSDDDNILKNLSENYLDQSRSRKALHYLCTEIEPNFSSLGFRKDGSATKVTTSDSSASLQSHNNNNNLHSNAVSFDNFNNNNSNNQTTMLNKSLMDSSSGSSTDSDFESLPSSILSAPGDDFTTKIKSHTNSTKLIRSNNVNGKDEVDGVSNGSVTRTSSGRVRALIQKLEEEAPGQTQTRTNRMTQSLYLSQNHTKDLSEMAMSRKANRNMAKLSGEGRLKDEQRRNMEELSKSMSIKYKMYVKRVSSKVGRYTCMSNFRNECAPHLFDCCLLIGLNVSTRVPYIKYKYPPDYDVPPWLEMLCFPDASHWNWDSNTNQFDGAYSLVLTNENGQRKFGFCRRLLPEGELVFLPLAYCILTSFKATGFYSKILEELECRYGLPDVEVDKFLRALYETPFPRPGQSVKLHSSSSELLESIEAIDPEHKKEFVVVSRQIQHDKDARDSDLNRKSATINPRQKLLRSYSSPLLQVPEKTKKLDEENGEQLILTRPMDGRVIERDMALLVDSIKLNVLIQIFGSLLLERKVILICSTISKLSSCVEALQSMLYPFSWQHTFIPILPSNMLEFLSAPTPLVVGVLKEAYEDAFEVEDGIVVDIDSSLVLSYTGDEETILPNRLSRLLKSAISTTEIRASSSITARNVLISEAFISAFIQICGNYQLFIIDNSPESPRFTFDKESFIKSCSSKSIQLFLEWFTETAMFNAFIETQISNKLTKTRNDCTMSNIFETRVNEYNERIGKKKTLGEKLKNWTTFS